jgi:GNAT superfamily N-acetyltransferase
VNVGVGTQYFGVAVVGGIAAAEVGMLTLLAQGSRAVHALRVRALSVSTNLYLWGTGAVTATGSFLNQNYVRIHNFLASKYSLVEGIFTTSAEVVTGGDLSGMPSAGDFVPPAASRQASSFLSEGAEFIGDGIRTVPRPYFPYTKNVTPELIEFTLDDGYGGIMGRIEGEKLIIEIVQVDEAFEGKGVGTQLYKLLIEEAGGANISKVEGFMTFHNAEALEKYGDIAMTPRAKILSKLGFKYHTYDPTTRTAVSYRFKPN